jgi:hypothetical protein
MLVTRDVAIGLYYVRISSSGSLPGHTATKVIDQIGLRYAETVLWSYVQNFAIEGYSRVR